MPNPTPVGTAQSSYAASVTTRTVSLTIPVGASAVVAFLGGYSNTTVSSVTLDGNAMENIVSGQNGTAQYGGVFYMDDADANWPGDGAFNVVGTATGGGSFNQVHLLATCFQDVDTTTQGYRTGVAASGNVDDPNVSLTGITTSTDTMVYGSCYYSNQNAAATTGTLIIEVDNTTSASSSIFTYDNAPAGSSDTIGTTTDAAVEHWSGAFALIGTGAGGGATPAPRTNLQGCLTGPFGGPIG